MPNPIKIYGNVIVSTYPKTIKDIKDFMKVIEQMRLPDDFELLDGLLSVEFNTNNVEMVECGEHLSGDTRYNWLVSTHDHDKGK